MSSNNYYDIAIKNDYRYLKHNLGLDFYNNTLPLMQQICEKLFKSVLIDFDLVDIDLPILRSHKLDRLYETIKAEIQIPFDNKNRRP